MRGRRAQFLVFSLPPEYWVLYLFGCGKLGKPRWVTSIEVGWGNTAVTEVIRHRGFLFFPIAGIQKRKLKIGATEFNLK